MTSDHHQVNFRSFSLGCFLSLLKNGLKFLSKSLKSSIFDHQRTLRSHLKFTNLLPFFQTSIRTLTISNCSLTKDEYIRLIYYQWLKKLTVTTFQLIPTERLCGTSTNVPFLVIHMLYRKSHNSFHEYQVNVESFIIFDFRFWWQWCWLGCETMENFLQLPFFLLLTIGIDNDFSHVIFHTAVFSFSRLRFEFFLPFFPYFILHLH